MIDIIKQWLQRTFHTELPCGCIATDSNPPRFSNDTTVINRELDEDSPVAYRNCTKTEYEWILTIQCDHCEAYWFERISGGTKIDYGAENPDAKTRLETRTRGRRVYHSEEPIVQEDEVTG